MSIICAITGRHWYREMTGGTRNGIRLVFWSKCRFCPMTRMRKGRP